MKKLPKSPQVLGIIKEPVGITDDVLLFDNNIDDTSLGILTIPDLAKLFKISLSSVRRLIDQRRIPFYKVGGSVRFLRKDVSSYLAKQRISVIE